MAKKKQQVEETVEPAVTDGEVIQYGKFLIKRNEKGDWLVSGKLLGYFEGSLTLDELKRKLDEFFTLTDG